MAAARLHAPTRAGAVLAFAAAGAAQTQARVKSPLSVPAGPNTCMVIDLGTNPADWDRQDVTFTYEYNSLIPKGCTVEIYQARSTTCVQSMTTNDEEDGSQESACSKWGNDDSWSDSDWCSWVGGSEAGIGVARTDLYDDRIGDGPTTDTYNKSTPWGWHDCQNSPVKLVVKNNCSTPLVSKGPITLYDEQEYTLCPWVKVVGETNSPERLLWYFMLMVVIVLVCIVCCYCWCCDNNKQDAPSRRRVADVSSVVATTGPDAVVMGVPIVAPYQVHPQTQYPVVQGVIAVAQPQMQCAAQGQPPVAAADNVVQPDNDNVVQHPAQEGQPDNNADTDVVQQPECGAAVAAQKELATGVKKV